MINALRGTRRGVPEAVVCLKNGASADTPEVLVVTAESGRHAYASVNAELVRLACGPARHQYYAVMGRGATDSVRVLSHE